MSIWWTLHLRRDAASVPFARRILLRTMDTAGVDPDVSHDIGVALSEACANVVEHAGGATGAPQGYQVTARIEGNRCLVEVRDSGPGFPEPEPGGRQQSAPGPVCAGDRHAPGRRAVRALEAAESGRGMYLIEALVDHVRFRNHPRRGAVVSFDKVLKWRDDALLKVS